MPTVTPAMLAADARNLLPIPVPAVQTNGWGPGAALVNLPTWWWVTNANGSLTQRTSLGAVWAEVTATPVTSTWTPNTPSDAPVTCTGMGIAWQQGMSEDQAGHCAVTYTTASFRRLAGADQAFPSSLEVTWKVTWVGDTPRLTLAQEYSRGQRREVSVGWTLGRDGPTRDYRFSTEDLKEPLRRAVTGAGWTWRPVAFGKL